MSLRFAARPPRTRSAIIASSPFRGIRNRERNERDASDLPKQVRSEIEKFFVATDELESKELKFLGWKGPKTGQALIDKAAKKLKKGNRKG